MSSPAGSPQITTCQEIKQKNNVIWIFPKELNIPRKTLCGDRSAKHNYLELASSGENDRISTHSPQPYWKGLNMQAWGTCATSWLKLLVELKSQEIQSILITFSSLQHYVMPSEILKAPYHLLTNTNQRQPSPSPLSQITTNSGIVWRCGPHWWHTFGVVSKIMGVTSTQEMGVTPTQVMSLHLGYAYHIVIYSAWCGTGEGPS